MSFGFTRCAFAALTLVLAPATASGATAEGAFAVRGLGTQSCATVVEAADNAQDTNFRPALAGWIAGYLTQASRSAQNVYEVMPINDIGIVTEIAINLCRQDSEIMLEAAVSTLIQSLRFGVQRQETALIEVSHDGRSVQLRQEVLRLVQQHLIDRQFLAGPADGAFGAMTRDGLLRFQQANDLPVTGIPDAATLITMFSPS